MSFHLLAFFDQRAASSALPAASRQPLRGTAETGTGRCGPSGGRLAVEQVVHLDVEDLGDIDQDSQVGEGYPRFPARETAWWVTFNVQPTDWIQSLFPEARNTFAPVLRGSIMAIPFFLCLLVRNNCTMLQHERINRG
jgi:hypothetical protein